MRVMPPPSQYPLAGQNHIRDLQLASGKPTFAVCLYALVPASARLDLPSSWRLPERKHTINLRCKHPSVYFRDIADISLFIILTSGQ